MSEAAPADSPRIDSTPRDWTGQSKGRSFRAQQRQRTATIVAAMLALVTLLGLIVYLTAFSTQTVPPLQIFPIGITEYENLPPHRSGYADAMGLREVGETWAHESADRVRAVSFSNTLQGQTGGGRGQGSFLTAIERGLGDAAASRANVLLLVSTAAVETKTGVALVAIDAETADVAGRSGGRLISTTKLLEKLVEYARGGSGIVVVAFDVAAPGPDWTLGTLQEDLVASFKDELGAELTRLKAPPDRFCVLLSHSPNETNWVYLDPLADVDRGANLSEAERLAAPAAATTERDAVRRSIFGQAIIEALQGRADLGDAEGEGRQPDQVVSLGEFVAYVSDRVSQWTTTKRATSQTVIRLGGDRGELPLIATELRGRTYDEILASVDSERLEVTGADDEAKVDDESEMMTRAERRELEKRRSKEQVAEAIEADQAAADTSAQVLTLWKELRPLGEMPSDRPSGTFTPELVQLRRRAARTQRLLLAGLLEEADEEWAALQPLRRAVLAPDGPPDAEGDRNDRDGRDQTNDRDIGQYGRSDAGRDQPNSIAARRVESRLHGPSDRLSREDAQALDGQFESIFGNLLEKSDEELEQLNPIRRLPIDRRNRFAAWLWDRASQSQTPRQLVDAAAAARRLETVAPNIVWPSEIVYLAGLPHTISPSTPPGGGGQRRFAAGAAESEVWADWLRVLNLRRRLSSERSSLAVAAGYEALLGPDLDEFVRSLVAAERWLRSGAAAEFHDSRWLSRAETVWDQFERRADDLALAEELLLRFDAEYAETATWAALEVLHTREQGDKLGTLDTTEVDKFVGALTQAAKDDAFKTDVDWPAQKRTTLEDALIRAATAFRDLKGQWERVRQEAETAEQRRLSGGGDPFAASGFDDGAFGSSFAASPRSPLPPAADEPFGDAGEGGEAAGGGLFKQRAEAFQDLHVSLERALESWGAVRQARLGSVNPLFNADKPTAGQRRLLQRVVDLNWFDDSDRRAQLADRLLRSPARKPATRKTAADDAYFAGWGLLTLHALERPEQSKVITPSVVGGWARLVRERAKTDTLRQHRATLGIGLADAFAKRIGDGPLPAVGWRLPPVRTDAGKRPSGRLLAERLKTLWSDAALVDPEHLASSEWMRQVDARTDRLLPFEPKPGGLLAERTGRDAAESRVASDLLADGELSRLAQKLVLLSDRWRFRSRVGSGREIDFPRGRKEWTLDLRAAGPDAVDATRQETVHLAVIGRADGIENYPLAFVPVTIRPQLTTDGWAIEWWQLEESVRASIEDTPVTSETLRGRPVDLEQRDNAVSFFLPPLTTEETPVELMPVLRVDNPGTAVAVRVEMKQAESKGSPKRLSDEPIPLQPGRSLYPLPMPPSFESGDVEIREGLEFVVTPITDAGPDVEKRQTLSVRPRLFPWTQFLDANSVRAELSEESSLRVAFDVRERPRGIDLESVPVELKYRGTRALSDAQLGSSRPGPDGVAFGTEKTLRLPFAQFDDVGDRTVGTSNFEAWLDVAGWPGAVRWRIEQGRLTRLPTGRATADLRIVRPSDDAAAGGQSVATEPDGTVLISKKINSDLVTLPIPVAVYAPTMDEDSDRRDDIRWFLNGRLFDVPPNGSPKYRGVAFDARAITRPRRETVELRAGAGGVWELRTAVGYHVCPMRVDDLGTGVYELEVELRSSIDERGSAAVAKQQIVVDNDPPQGELVVASAGRAARGEGIVRMTIGDPLEVRFNFVDDYSQLATAKLWFDRSKDKEPQDEELPQVWPPSGREGAVARAASLTLRLAGDQLPDEKGIYLVYGTATDRAGNVVSVSRTIQLVEPDEPEPPEPPPSPPQTSQQMASQPMPEPAAAPPAKPPKPKPKSKPKPKKPQPPGAVKFVFSRNKAVDIELRAGSDRYSGRSNYEPTTTISGVKPGTYTATIKYGTSRSRSKTETVTVEPGRTAEVRIDF